MKLIINIDEDTYKDIKKGKVYSSMRDVPQESVLAIANGIPLEQEPCDDVCEWFEQYVDIATDIVELRFSDGTVKRAKRGLYMRDIEKSIRKMLIDQVTNEKKQDYTKDEVIDMLTELQKEIEENVLADDPNALSLFLQTRETCVAVIQQKIKEVRNET